MSKIDEESDKKPQPGSIYFRLENNRLFYKTCFSDKEEEIIKNDLIAEGMNDQIRIPSGSNLCEALFLYKDVIWNCPYQTRPLASRL